VRIFYNKILCAQVRRRLAAKEGGAAARRRVRAGQPALRLHWHRQLGPGYAAARPERQGEQSESKPRAAIFMNGGMYRYRVLE